MGASQGLHPLRDETRTQATARCLDRSATVVAALLAHKIEHGAYGKVIVEYQFDGNGLAEYVITDVTRGR